MSALTTTPPATRATIIRAVLAEAHPKLAMGAIAHRFHLTMADLQAILRDAGYPARDKLAAAATHLEHAVAVTATPASVTTRPETGTRTPAGATPPEDGILAKVRVADLHADPDNPREHLDGIDELADSIQEIGLLQPIVARRDAHHRQVLYVVAGHRRLAAVRQLHWTHVDVIIRNPMRPDTVLAAMLIENGQRTDLDPIEEARGLAKLKTLDGCTDVELGRKIGRSGAHVSNRLALLRLSAEDQEAVRTGNMKLMEATHKGRLNAGRVQAPGHKNRGWHLGPAHDLALQVKARCRRLGHSGSRTVGGMGCGECWEEVIRADERAHLHQASAQRGSCAICGTAQ